MSIRIRFFWNRWPHDTYVGLLFRRYGGTPRDGDVTWRMGIGLIWRDCGVYLVKYRPNVPRSPEPDPLF